VDVDTAGRLRLSPEAWITPGIDKPGIVIPSEGRAQTASRLLLAGCVARPESRDLGFAVPDGRMREAADPLGSALSKSTLQPNRRSLDSGGQRRADSARDGSINFHFTWAGVRPTGTRGSLFDYVLARPAKEAGREESASAALRMTALRFVAIGLITAPLRACRWNARCFKSLRAHHSAPRRMFQR